MARRRLAVLTVAIDDYPEDFYLDGEERLHSAVRGAKLISWYVRRCWPDPRDRRRVTLRNDRATLANILAAARDLATRLPAGERLDIFLVYIAGHGRIDRGRGALCTFPSGEETGLDASTLDELLRVVPALQTFLIVDCCHAAAVVAGSTYFARLDAPSRGRMFITSADADQLSWEHRTLQSSLLMQAIGEAIMAASARDPWLDVDALFPSIHQRVRELAASLKGAAQEPVKGGMTAAPMRLPVSRAMLPRHTRAAAALWRRRWSIAAAALTIFVVIAVLVHLFVFYIAPTNRGYLGIWSGVRALTWLVPGEYGLRVETPFEMTDLFPNANAKRALQSGDVSGLWMPQQGATRSWNVTLGQWLDLEPQVHWFVLQGHPYPDSSGPGEEQRFAGLGSEGWGDALVLDAPAQRSPVERASWIASVIDWNPCLAAKDAIAAHLQKVVDDADPYDRGFLFRDIRAEGALSIDLARAGRTTETPFALALLRLAAADGAVEFSPYNPNEMQEPVAQAELATDILRVSAASRGSIPAEVQQLVALGGGRCTVVRDYALARLRQASRLPDGLANFTRAVQTLHSTDKRTFDETIALRGLAEVAAADALPDSAYRLVQAKLSHTEWCEWLFRVVPHAAPPAWVLDEILARLDSLQQSRRDPYPAGYELIVVERGARALTTSQRARFLAFLRRGSGDRVIQTWGWLALAGVKPPPDLVERLSMGAQSLEENDAGIVALARIAQAMPVSADAEVYLRVYVFAYPDRLEVEEIYRALASIERRKRSVDSGLRPRLDRWRRDAKRRKIETRIMIEEFSLLPPAERTPRLTELHAEWEREREPELRAAFGEIILQVRRSEQLDSLPLSR